ncbi:MAG: LysM peptidoglycan-binding domain-containing protein [Planctomycetaceae bacterium]|jgi:nucleoid-associated protein YgaU|nr:LysM peptidoglycan-binding domain-containing protein [Planctomycetaceae bacterium]
MSNKNQFNSSNNLSVTNPPLPLPSRDEIAARENVTAKSQPDNISENDNYSNDNILNNEGLAALVNNAAAANDNYQENSNEINLNNNIASKLINIVTKIRSRIYDAKSIFSNFTKLTAGAKFLLQFIKSLSSYFVLKIDDENLENGENIDPADKDKIKNQNEKQTQIKTQTQSENSSAAQKSNKTTTDTRSNIVTKNPSDPTADSPSTTTSSTSIDLYNDDNDIYEGFTWQSALIKSAVFAAALLLLVASYIGIKSILYPKTDNAIAIKESTEQTNQTADQNNRNSTPDKLFDPTNPITDPVNSNRESQPTTSTSNANYANNNSTRELAPTFNLPESAAANNNNQRLTSTESNNENINNAQPQPTDSNPQPAADIFASTLSPTTTPSANPSNNSTSVFPSASTSPNTASFPSDNYNNNNNNNANNDNNNLVGAFPSLPSTNPANSETSAITTITTPSTENNLPFDDSSTPLLSLATNNATATPADNASATVDESKIIQANNTSTENENNKESDDKNSDLKSIEKLNVNQNAEMAPLVIADNIDNSPISVTNTTASSTIDTGIDPKNITDSTTATSTISATTNSSAELEKSLDKNKTDLNKVTSAPMESLQIPESNPNVLVDSDSTLRVPPQDHALIPNQDNSDSTSFATANFAANSTADKSSQPISVTKNDNSLSIIPDSKVQPRFTEASPPTPANDITLPEMPEVASMRTLETVASSEITPSIPTASDTVKPITTESFTATPNFEPSLRIPAELPPSEKSINPISVAQNDADKISSPKPLNLQNPVNSSTDTTTSPMLTFDNAMNNRNDNSGNSNDKKSNDTNPTVAATLFNETNNPPSNETLLPVPTSSDDQQTNKLLALLPSSDGGVIRSETTGNIASSELTTLQDTAPAELAENNPGYRRSVSSRDPASVQIKNSAAALSPNAATTVYQEQLDREITRSPENAELYTVKSGDTYMSICDNYYGTGLLYRALAVHNRNRGAAWIPAEGSQIEIPTADYLKTNYSNVLARSNRYNSRNNNATSSIAATASPTYPTTSTISTTQSNIASVAQPNGTVYIVQQGDSVFKIAQDQLKDTSRWREIIKFNSDKLQSARDLKPGMQIILPTSTASGYKRLN